MASCSDKDKSSDKDNELREQIQLLQQNLLEYTKYVALFKGPTERYRHIRVVFIGQYGVGKTTLCRRIRKKAYNLKLRKPTVGAELHPSVFFVDWESKRWDREVSDSSINVIAKRMGALMKDLETVKTEPSSPTAVLSRGVQDDSGSSNLPPESPEEVDQTFNEASLVNISALAAVSDGAFLSLWDMGGHRSFQASHNVFLSSHGVYLLVFKLTDFIKDKLETDRLKKWIRLIGTFSSEELNAPRQKPHNPPLIFVGTFLDELKKTTPDYNKLIEKIQWSIARFPELSAHKFVRFCTVDNSLGFNDTKLDELRGYITEVAVHQDQWGRELPSRWLKLEMDLQLARNRGVRILTLEEVIEMNQTSIAPFTDVDEIKLALEIMLGSKAWKMSQDQQGLNRTSSTEGRLLENLVVCHA